MPIKHEWNGTVLTITSDSGTSSCDLKGEKGDTGVRGVQGIAGNCAEGTGIASINRTSGDGTSGSIDVYTITLTNGQTSTFEVYNGIDGVGQQGENGISVSGATVNSDGNLIITLSDATTLDCGKVKGADGKNGQSITHLWNGTQLYINSASGTSFADLKGEKGDKGDTGVVECDTTPTEGSSKPITSGAVYTALQNIDVSSEVIWNDFPINTATVSRPDDTGMVYTKVNSVVSIQGTVKLLNRLANGVSTIIGTLPAGYRPYRTITDVRNMGGAFYQLQVSTTGEVSVISFAEGGLSNSYALFINIEYIAGN